MTEGRTAVVGVARGGGVWRRWGGFVAVLAVTAGGERMGVRRRGEVVYLTAVFILVVAAAAASGMLIFKLYDQAVQLYDQTGDEKAVRLVKLGIAIWLILVLSSALWLIIVTSERRSRREAGICCGGS